MKRTNKKGFTIVELVIVIAVIAILAAVLIPTFASLVKKAHESTDVQAVKNMNTYLAAENATGDIKSILDVYDVFEGSGYVVKNYAPLYEGRQFFYSVEDNQIVYVDSESKKIVFPENMEGQEQGSKTWLSLNMQGVVSAEPTGDAGSYAYTRAAGETKAKIEATVKTAEGYLYVIEKYNEKSNEGKDALDLTLTIDGVIDMMGTSCTIELTKGSTVTIQAAKDDNGDAKTAVLKNITSTGTYGSGQGAQGAKDGIYNSSALIAKMVDSGSVSISDITLENANVRTLEGGNVAFLVGSASGTVAISNVTIKDSTVIGHRNVGALIGNAQSGTTTIKGDITMTNVSVQTIGGRSARLIGLEQTGKLSTSEMNLIEDNFTLSIYENAASKQNTNATVKEGGCVGYNDPDCYIECIEAPYSDSKQETSNYPYWNNADVLKGESSGKKVTAQKWNATSKKFVASPAVSGS